MRLESAASAGYLTNWAARLFARAIDRELKPLGLSSGQLPVFFALAEGAALSQKALTRIAAVEQPTMAATLARMERDGLVERRPDPKDRRSVLLALTPLAIDKAAAVAAATARINGVALSGLDQAAALATLRAMVGNLEADAAGL